jgi:hypothetical protein
VQNIIDEYVKQGENSSDMLKDMGNWEMEYYRKEGSSCETV